MDLVRVDSQQLCDLLAGNHQDQFLHVVTRCAAVLDRSAVEDQTRWPRTTSTDECSQRDRVSPAVVDRRHILDRILDQPQTRAPVVIQSSSSEIT